MLREFLDSKWSAHAPLSAAQALGRPVVMVPGLNMEASSYDPMAEHFAAEPGNGHVITYVAASRSFRAGGKDGPQVNEGDLSSAKIFRIEYEKRQAGPAKKAPQISALLPKIAQLTGSVIDVVTHSAGGHDFRLYLDERQSQDVKIGKLVMVGPVTHGTVMGDLGAVFGVGEIQEAAKQLAVDADLVKRLDDSWPRQRDQIAEGVTIVGITGAATPVAGGGFKDGDGFVAADELGLPGAKVVVLRGVDPTALAHLKEIEYSGVVNEVQAALSR